MATEFEADFDCKFYEGEGVEVDDELKAEVEQHLRKLAEGHTDLIGASVAVERPAHRETPFIYTARIVAFKRPENVVGREQADSIELALRGALRAVERQIRENRDRLTRRWEHPGR